MTYQKEEPTKLRRQFSKQAIALAMQGRWREVVDANKLLLESFPNDVDAYNRLGRAYMELGEYTQAKNAYEKTVEIDPYNAIAKKSLDRLSHLGDTVVDSEADVQKVEPEQFIEEIGKAGVVNLYRLARLEILAKAVAGSRVNLKIEGLDLRAENIRGEYLGLVEPKHAQRLIKLIKGGNKYTAAIVSSSPEAVVVIIREVYQDPSQVGRLSFPPKGTEGFRTYVGDRIIRRELEYEEALPGEPSYTIIGGDEAELLPGEAPDAEDEIEEE
ncbi:MAG: tetratricopeptide repeat protein [Dehalococcoidales bacterium]|nr:tetratricopeptide repeat protein [Dehalococcoidales bacterium]